MIFFLSPHPPVGTLKRISAYRATSSDPGNTRLISRERQTTGPIHARFPDGNISVNIDIFPNFSCSGFSFFGTRRRNVKLNEKLFYETGYCNEYFKASQFIQ